MECTIVHKNQWYSSNAESCWCCSNSRIYRYGLYTSICSKYNHLNNTTMKVEQKKKAPIRIRTKGIGVNFFKEWYTLPLKPHCRLQLFAEQSLPVVVPDYTTGQEETSVHNYSICISAGHPYSAQKAWHFQAIHYHQASLLAHQ